MKLVVALVFCIFLFGCAMATNPVPETYAGPTATVTDSTTAVEGDLDQMFWVAAIDGKGIPNSYVASQAASRGQGPFLTTKIVSRRVEAKPQSVKLIGSHITAAPIIMLLAMPVGKFTTIEGEVEFTPSPGGAYVVKGDLRDKGAVWIEDANTHEIVTEIVTKKSPRSK